MGAHRVPVRIAVLDGGRRGLIHLDGNIVGRNSRHLVRDFLRPARIRVRHDNLQNPGVRRVIQFNLIVQFLVTLFQVQVFDDLFQNRAAFHHHHVVVGQVGADLDVRQAGDGIAQHIQRGGGLILRHHDKSADDQCDGCRHECRRQQHLPVAQHFKKQIL